MAYSMLGMHNDRFQPTQMEPLSPGPPATDYDDSMEIDVVQDIFRIAVDFGTTFSSVAYTRASASQQITTLQDIECVAGYPGDCRIPIPAQTWEPRQDVPTELLYPKAPRAEGRWSNDTGFAHSEVRSDHDTSSDSDSNDSSSEHTLEGDQQQDNIARSLELNRGGTTEKIAWGFEVQNPLSIDGVDQEEDVKVSRFKLILEKPKEDSDKALKIQSETMIKLAKLKRSKLIASDTDVITHFLEKLFIHVRSYLQANHQVNQGDKMEFTLCVPAVWPSKACRVMQDSMAKAAEKSGLCQLKDGSLENLFIVSEPEAAAACILAEGLDSIYYGETIVILDAGGGTVDATTYKVTNSNPLRMSAEVIAPKTMLCGASYINEEYRAFLFDKLKNETYLEKNGKTIQSIIDRKVIDFENVLKRVWDIKDKKHKPNPVYIDDLQPSPTDPQLTRNHLRIENKDIKRVFKYPVEGTIEVLRDQLEMARAKGETVQKVILTGGFGQSPYLQSKLRRFLKKQRNLDDQIIPLLVSKASSTAVARGAILRASNKEFGPVRISSCSYGVLSTEPYEPRVLAAHKATRSRIDPVDGEKYVHNTIRWLFQKGEELKVGREQAITVRHTFSTTRKRFICEEVLYVSDDKKESHYRSTHPMNKGAEKAGIILVDMTFLRDEGHISPEAVSPDSAFAGKKKQVYVVEFELMIRVVGRNLVYEARWPINGDGEGRVQARGQISIAATFRPGTA